MKKIKPVKLETSVIIAIIAVLISLVSTYIGLKESDIMMKQQEISIEQQAASVWPYVEILPQISFEKNNSVTYKLIAKNKGVGPAIIDSILYELDEMRIKAWELGNKLRIKYPKLKIRQIQNTILDDRVLSPGETITVVTVRIQKPDESEISLHEVTNNLKFHLSFCFCSIYGKCWKINENKKPSKSNDCKINRIIN